VMMISISISVSVILLRNFTGGPKTEYIASRIFTHAGGIFE